MSVRSSLLITVLMLCSRLVYAQGQDRFFGKGQAGTADPTVVEDQPGSTTGSLTFSTFLYKEFGAQAPPEAQGQIGSRVSSPVMRWFSDLRAQLTARRLKNSKYDVRADFRVRYLGSAANPDTGVPLNTIDVFGNLPVQSGQQTGNELDLRELYVRRDGEKTDITFGRQFILELASIKVDGVQANYTLKPQWTLLGFGGLYPVRGSRDLGDDYPKIAEEPLNPMSTQKRVVPVIAGAGAAYNTSGAYGSFGLVGILPRARQLNGVTEKTRAFLTAQGYVRASRMLDLFHFALLDFAGEHNGITNLTVGANLKPHPAVHLNAQLTRIDTETLNVQAQAYLESPDPQVHGLIQNNAIVTRVAQNSARFSASFAFSKQRFELTTFTTLRRRDAVTLTADDNTTKVALPAGSALDIGLAFNDRRTGGGWRWGVNALRTQGLGSVNLNRSTSNSASLEVSKELSKGRGELETSVQYVGSNDETVGIICNPGDILTCYGAANSNSIGLNSIGSWRLADAWWGIGSLGLGRQRINMTNLAGQLVAQPAAFWFNAFVRVAVRF